MNASQEDYARKYLGEYVDNMSEEEKVKVWNDLAQETIIYRNDYDEVVEQIVTQARDAEEAVRILLRSLNDYSRNDDWFIVSEGGESIESFDDFYKCSELSEDELLDKIVDSENYGSEIEEDMRRAFFDDWLDECSDYEGEDRDELERIYDEEYTHYDFATDDWDDILYDLLEEYRRRHPSVRKLLREALYNALKEHPVRISSMGGKVYIIQGDDVHEIAYDDYTNALDGLFNEDED